MIQVTPNRSVSFPYSGVNTDGPGSCSTVLQHGRPSVSFFQYVGTSSASVLLSES